MLEHLAELPLIFQKKFPGFPNFFLVLKVRIFKSIFSLKLSLRLLIVFYHNFPHTRFDSQSNMNIFKNPVQFEFLKKFWLVQIVFLNLIVFYIAFFSIPVFYISHLVVFLVLRLIKTVTVSIFSLSKHYFHPIKQGYFLTFKVATLITG